MKSKANTIVIAFILLPLALSICGCQEPKESSQAGIKPPAPSPLSPPFLKGLELGRGHRIEQLRTYRLLIALVKSYPTSSPTCELDRNEFLRGFGAAYADATARANRVKDLLKKSLLLEHG